ncbi:hypothetical protein NAPIS_ORF02517 [Vairimorpha apis BRL 01]|uniref:5'-3' DNA helicase ZGRF1-like N-terminal domain-containing protein n=1 Tax=Vairimorpha apis BRL 01 TaxID=1037528 RepID=T0L5B4_9MICR|nr:hypothetical protein NAPIS_ORF02517 [Vairimorpha apis BRL 01]
MYPCIYTKDKKKKLKNWLEGFYTYKPNKLILYDSDKKYLCSKQTPLINDIDTFKYLVYIEDINQEEDEEMKNKFEFMDNKDKDLLFKWYKSESKVVDDDNNKNKISDDDKIGFFTEDKRINSDNEKINESIFDDNDILDAEEKRLNLDNKKIKESNFYKINGIDNDRLDAEYNKNEDNKKINESTFNEENKVTKQQPLVTINTNTIKSTADNEKIDKNNGYTKRSKNQILNLFNKK